jgi:LytS/YehU family sensor histidine kinase
MTVVQEGEYAVDFHAQLSTLQAFSICVAILHGTEASVDAEKERSKQLSQSNSLKVLNEEVQLFIDAVTREEKRKVTKMVKEIPPSYVLNPPFSPISRV